MENIDREYQNPLVSIIIPRHGEDLTQVLEAINNSSYNNIETLVIDKGLERSQQRNLGIIKSQGCYLLILDADQVISPNLIKECVDKMNCGIGGMYIPEIIKTKGLFAYIRNWERQFYNATPIDVVRFVRAKNCPLFDTELSGPEDSSWDRQISGLRLTSKNPLYHHDSVNFFSYMRKKNYYGQSMEKYKEKHPNDRILDWRWRCFIVFFERNNWKRVLKRPDLMILVWCLIFIRGIIYLKNIYIDKPK